MPEPAPERTQPDRSLVLDVHEAALQEIDTVVGNQATLGENETSTIRGILFAALGGDWLEAKSDA